MADTKASALIRKQLEQLLNNAPPPLTQAEREQIMKGRKKQADIDAGRAAIQARADEIAKHQKQIDDLTTKLGKTETEEGAAAEKAKREESADVWKDIAGPAGAGVALGGGTSFALNKIVGAGDKARSNALIAIGDEIGDTRDLTASQVNRSRAVGAAKAAEKYAPTNALAKSGNFLKRAGTYAVPAGFIGYEYSRYHDMANDEGLPWEQRQNAGRVANALLGGFTGVGVEGAARFLNRKEEPGVGRAMMRIEAARDLANRFDAKELGLTQGAVQDRGAIANVTPQAALRTIDVQPQAAPQIESKPSKSAAAPAKAEPPKPSGDLPYRDRLKMAVESVGGKPGKTKQANYDAFKAGLTNENLPEVAKALNLPEGATKSTVLQRAREMLRTSGKGAYFLPMLAGGLAYNMADSPAEAADGTGATSDVANKAIAGGTAAGTVAGVQQILSRVPPVVGKALSAGGSMAAPSAMVDATDEFASPEARNWAARNFPEALQFGAVGQAREMAQVPERSPANSGPRNALADGRPYANNAMAQSPELDAILRELSTLVSR